MRIMSVDYGESRTGLAACDRTEFLASPLGVIHEKDYLATINKVAIAAKEYEIQEVIVGLPLNMDGSEGEKAVKCRDFAAKLEAIIDVPVKLWDERQTTMQAHNYLNDTNVRGQKRKNVVDEVAAVIILESYLRFRENHK
ncbi:MAG: Holliday junction resolvase RuvX [Oscillospiraceae bacterium]